MLNKLRSQIWAILWVFIILVFCFAKFPIAPKGPSLFFEGFDKVVHLGMFFVLSVFILFGKMNAKITNSSFVKILFVTTLLAGGIELLQKYVFTYRGAEWWDFICDMLGVSMALFGFILLHFKTYYNENKK